jgi:hypothetical protein
MSLEDFVEAYPTFLERFPVVRPRSVGMYDSVWIIASMMI